MNLAMQGGIRIMSSEEMICSRIARTESVRVEFLRYRPQATVQWNVARPPLDHPDGDAFVPSPTAKNGALAPRAQDNQQPQRASIRCCGAHRPSPRNKLADAVTRSPA
jgi:hypothetical protein